METVQESKVVEFVREQLAPKSVSMTEVANATNVSKRWLEMIRAGQLPKPGIENLEIVARHFGYEFQPVKIVPAPQPAEAASPAYDCGGRL